MKKIISFVLTIGLLISVFAMPIVNAANDEFCFVFDLTGVNTERIACSLVVYTPDHGSETGTSGSGLEFVVDENGKVTEIGSKNSKIPANGFVLSAGPAKKSAVSSVKVGDYVAFEGKYNCVTIVSDGYNPFSSETIKYDGINVTRAQDKLIIYRNKANTGTNTWGSEACVDASGLISSVGGNNNAIPEGGYVISGVGTQKTVVETVCKLGYSAEIDEALKTITISYTKENAAGSFKLRIDKAMENYNKAYMEFADIDDEAVKASLDLLDELYTKIQEALSNDDVVTFAALSTSFDKEYQLLEYALIPYVPVESRTLWLRIPTKSDDDTVERVVNEIYDMGFNSVCIELLFDCTTIMPMPEDSLFEHNPVFKGRDIHKYILHLFY